MQSTSPGTSPSRSRYWLSTNDRIDIYRGLFAFLVVSAHALEVTCSMLPDTPARFGGVARRVLLGTAGSGIYWVMGFFVISGYCIQLSVQRLGARGTFPLKTYLIARLTRILPLYYLALAFTVLAEWWMSGYRPNNWPHGLNNQVLAYQVSLLQNLTQTYGSFAPSWSITNEAFYYVFYGLLVMSFSRNRLRPIAVGIATCIGVGVLLDVVYHALPRSPVLLGTSMLFGLGTNWFLGALVAAHRDRLACGPRIQMLARFWPLVLAASIGVRCAGTDGVEFVFMGSGLAFTLMLIRFLGVERRRAGLEGDASPLPLARGVVKGLGLASYPTYLFHAPIMMLVGSIQIRTGLVLDWRWNWALLAASGIASGIVGGYLVEAPIMRWRAALLRGLERDDRAGSSPGRLQPSTAYRIATLGSPRHHAGVG